ncbi:MAG: hypothetical protein RLZZ500_1174 [Bacteroidota bacterium]|jgi:hypothetical protein
MKKIGIIVLLFSLSLQAQDIQFASKLIKYSSDLGGKQFGIKRLLGKPDVFPQGGFSANAWMPKNALDGREVVSVGFEKAQSVKQIAIFENLNAGCVVAVAVSTDGEHFHSVWSRRPDYKTTVYRRTLGSDRAFYFGRKRRKIGEIPEIINPGVERIMLENSEPNVIAVKIEFNFALLPGAKQIDAIGISSSDQPLEAKIYTCSGAEQLEQKPTLQAVNVSIPCVYNGQLLYATSYENEQEAVCSFLLIAGKLGTKQVEPQFSGKNDYNFVEFISDSLILKGGVPYQRGTQESGYELFHKTGNIWVSNGPVRIMAYSNFDSFSDATMTSDGQTLILAIESDFTQGGTDMYCTHRKPDGSYGMLQSLGKMINSAADESSPQLLSDHKTLLFASNGFSGYGSHDLYVSYRLDDTWKNWSEPQNLGQIINSKEYEIQPFYDEVNQVLWFAVSSEEGVLLKSIPLPRKMITPH